MALIKCPECGKEVTDLEKKCIHCGYPINTSKREVPIKKIVIVVTSIIIILSIILIVIATNKLNESEKSEVNRVTEAILDIGEVSVDSDAVISYAENLYTELSSKCQRHIKNRKDLKQARDTYNKIVVENVQTLITQIGTVSVESSDAIMKAQKAYDSLPEELKENINNKNELSEAISKLSELQIENVIKKISNIGTVSLDSQKAIEDAKLVYYNLPVEERDKVHNSDVLLASEKAYEELSVQNCIELINDIGQVTLSSKKKIDVAQEAYNLLLPRLQDQVTNYNKLKTAKDNYDRLVKEEEDREKTLNVGDTFSTSKWQVTYKKSSVTAKIMPNSTSGYYTYYYADDDETYVDIVLKIKNINVDILGIADIVGDCEIIYDGKTMNKSYGLFISEGSDVDSVYSWDGLDALETTTLHVAITMPREVQSNKKAITVRIVIAGEEKIIKVR